MQLCQKYNKYIIPLIRHSTSSLFSDSNTAFVFILSCTLVTYRAVTECPDCASLSPKQDNFPKALVYVEKGSI